MSSRRYEAAAPAEDAFAARRARLRTPPPFGKKKAPVSPSPEAVPPAALDEGKIPTWASSDAASKHAPAPAPAEEVVAEAVAEAAFFAQPVDADAPPETGYGDEEFDSEETGDEGSYY